MLVDLKKIEELDVEEDTKETKEDLPIQKSKPIKSSYAVASITASYYSGGPLSDSLTRWRVIHYPYYYVPPKVFF